MNPYVSDSKIHGQGLFAGNPYSKGDLIGLAHMDGQPANYMGEYHNHSTSPNTESMLVGNKRFLVAKKKLRPDEEITVDYRKQPELEQPKDFGNPYMAQGGVTSEQLLNFLYEGADEEEPPAIEEVQQVAEQHIDNSVAERQAQDDMDEMLGLQLAMETGEEYDATGNPYRSPSAGMAQAGFRSFGSYEEGRQALEGQLELYKTGKTRNPVSPNSTLLEAMSVYAPAADNNNPKNYASFIAKKIGVTLDTPISQINTKRWADAIEIMEGNKTGNNPGNLRPSR